MPVATAWRPWIFLSHGEYADRNTDVRPRVVLLDLTLPKVGGMEVLCRMKGDIRSWIIPVVILTSSEKQNNVIESYNLGWTAIS
jgi:DNA-binding response OmpR family regulator